MQYIHHDFFIILVYNTVSFPVPELIAQAKAGLFLKFNILRRAQKLCNLILLTTAGSLYECP